MNRIKVAVSILCVLLAALAQPAVAAVTVVGGLTRQFSAQPGSTIEGRLVVQNTGDRPQEVKFYNTDYRFQADGRTWYEEPSGQARSSAPWVTIFPPQLTVPAGGSDSVSYVVNVPEDANLSGTYWSVLMVEPEAPVVSQAPGSAGEGVGIGIRTVVRQAVQMVVHIGDTGDRELAFSDRQLLLEGDQRVLQLDLENTGDRWLVPKVWVELYDRQGVAVGRFEGGQLRIYPGCSARFRMDLSDVPAGGYRALVVADCGSDDVFGAQYELDIP